MKRKILSIILVIMILFGTMFALTGCGGEKDISDGKNSDVSNVKKITNEITADNYGDTVNYSIKINKVNGQTLDNWRIFLKEDDTVYIIYGDYMPFEAIPTGIQSGTISGRYITKFDGDYTIGVTSLSGRKMLIDALTDPDKWKGLLSEELKEAGAIAKGSPTLEQYVSSWNEKYADDTEYNLYISETETEMEDGNYGYSIGTEPNATKDMGLSMKGSYGYKDASNDRGNEKKAGTLYYPHTEKFDECLGYWLATPSSAFELSLVAVSYNGNIGGDLVEDSDKTCRPIISLPADMLHHNEDGTWSIQ